MKSQFEDLFENSGMLNSVVEKLSSSVEPTESTQKLTKIYEEWVDSVHSVDDLDTDTLEKVTTLVYLIKENV